MHEMLVSPKRDGTLGVLSSAIHIYFFSQKLGSRVLAFPFLASCNSTRLGSHSTIVMLFFCSISRTTVIHAHNVECILCCYMGKFDENDWLLLLSTQSFLLCLTLSFWCTDHVHIMKNACFIFSLTVLAIVTTPCSPLAHAMLAKQGKQRGGECQSKRATAATTTKRRNKMKRKKIGSSK